VAICCAIGVASVHIGFGDSDSWHVRAQFKNPQIVGDFGRHSDILSCGINIVLKIFRALRNIKKMEPETESLDSLGTSCLGSIFWKPRSSLAGFQKFNLKETLWLQEK
jgi:hypothetical protein